jgi:hypothetical protein
LEDQQMAQDLIMSAANLRGRVQRLFSRFDPLDRMTWCCMPQARAAVLSAHTKHYRDTFRIPASIAAVK